MTTFILSPSAQVGSGTRASLTTQQCMRQRPMSAYRERDNGPPPAGEKPGIDFEAEDEKENDHHRWRARQSRDDPGAKACEATCIFCVGMLFLQVSAGDKRVHVCACSPLFTLIAPYSHGSWAFLGGARWIGPLEHPWNVRATRTPLTRGLVPCAWAGGVYYVHVRSSGDARAPDVP